MRSFGIDGLNWLGITVISVFATVAFSHFFITLPAASYPHLWKTLAWTRVILVFTSFLAFGYYLGVMILPNVMMGIAGAFILAAFCVMNPLRDLVEGVRIAEIETVGYVTEEIFTSSSEVSFGTNKIPKAIVHFSQQAEELEVHEYFYQDHLERCAAQGGTPDKVHYLRHLEVIISVECGGSGTSQDVTDFIRSRNNCLASKSAVSCYRAGRNYEKGIAVRTDPAKALWYFAESCRLGFDAICDRSPP